MLISSEFDELEALCTRTLLLNEGALVGELKGEEIDQARILSILEQRESVDADVERANGAPHDRHAGRAGRHRVPRPRPPQGEARRPQIQAAAPARPEHLGTGLRLPGADRPVRCAGAGDLLPRRATSCRS